MREYCRQGKAEVASNSRNKIHQTWAPSFSRALYTPRHIIPNRTEIGQVMQCMNVVHVKMDLDECDIECTEDLWKTKAVLNMPGQDRGRCATVEFIGVSNVL